MIPFRKKMLLPIVATLVAPIVSAAEKAEAIHMEKLTVTANKIEENINDVPQSITVIDQYEIEEKGIKSVPDIIKEIPNMSVSAGGVHGTTVSFRGLTPSTFTRNNPVVIYIDGVPSSDQYSFDASMANVERIEVLRGPQGTLYGKDAIGAVINIVTKEPDNEWTGNVGAEYGSNNHLFTTFNTSGALLDDTFYMGINGQGFQDDGWIENSHPGMDKDANSKEDGKLGAFFLYKPTDLFKIKLNLAYQKNSVNWLDGYALPGGTELAQFDRDDAENVAFDVPQITKTTIKSQSIKMSYEFKQALLEAITTHKSLILEGDYDADYGIDPLYAGLEMFGDNDIESWTQELRLSSKNSTGLRWVGGLYFESEKNKQAPYGMQFPQGGSNFEMNAESTADSTTQAVFGQIIMPLAEKLELTLGVRAQQIEKEIDLNTYYLPVGMTGDPMYQLNDKKSWNTVLPKVALSYQIDSNWSSFVSFSQGYMPGGYNTFPMQGNADDNSFDPQTSDNYEIGIKGGGQDFTLSASLFRMNIEDIHVYKSIGNLYLTDNAKKAHSQGVELDAAWYPTDTLELSGAFGLIDAKYDDYDTGVVKYDGQHIAGTPSHTARISLAYTHPENYYARLDINNQGEMYFFDNANNKMAKQGSYTVSDIKVGYNHNDWDIYGYVKNLTDEKYITEFMASSSITMASYGEPRTFGIGTRYHF